MAQLFSPLFQKRNDEMNFFFYLFQLFDCRNHIRVIQPIGDGTRLYVCGTNAHNPKDWVINVSLNLFSSLYAAFDANQPRTASD
jgi:Sema domain